MGGHTVQQIFQPCAVLLQLGVFNHELRSRTPIPARLGALLGCLMLVEWLLLLGLALLRLLWLLLLLLLLHGLVLLRSHVGRGGNHAVHNLGHTNANRHLRLDEALLLLRDEHLLLLHLSVLLGQEGCLGLCSVHLAVALDGPRLLCPRHDAVFINALALRWASRCGLGVGLAVVAPGAVLVQRATLAFVCVDAAQGLVPGVLVDREHLRAVGAPAPVNALDLNFIGAWDFDDITNFLATAAAPPSASVFFVRRFGVGGFLGNGPSGHAVPSRGRRHDRRSSRGQAGCSGREGREHSAGAGREEGSAVLSGVGRGEWARRKNSKRNIFWKSESVEH